MFEQFPLRCCKDHVCDCCLSEAEKSDKRINEEMKRMRARNQNEGKVILLGKYQTCHLNYIMKEFYLGNAEAGK